MYLTRLIYASTVSESCSLTALDEILNSSRSNNKSTCLTGLLSFNKKYFLQCLEGSRNEVNNTYNRILNDNRHKHKVILDYREIQCREFGDWSMGYIPYTNISSSVKLQFSGTEEFNPYEMSGESAYLLLIALKQNLPSV